MAMAVYYTTPKYISFFVHIMWNMGWKCCMTWESRHIFQTTHIFYPPTSNWPKRKIVRIKNTVSSELLQSSRKPVKCTMLQNSFQTTEANEDLGSFLSPRKGLSLSEIKYPRDYITFTFCPKTLKVSVWYVGCHLNSTYKHGWLLETSRTRKRIRRSDIRAYLRAVHASKPLSFKHVYDYCKGKVLLSREGTRILPPRSPIF